MKSVINDKNFELLNIALGAIAAVYYTTMYYVDNPVIFGAAYYRLECLFQGRVLDFLFDWSPIVPYGVFCQILFVIWVIPVKILSLIFGISLADSMGAYLWYKLFIVLVWWRCVQETKKIAVTLKMDELRIKWMGLFLSSSLLAFLPVFHLGQIDVVYLVFMLWGVRKYIEGNYKEFILAFLLANPVKYLSVFAYIPLILLKEKRIRYILRDICIGFILIPVEMLIKNMTGILCWLGAIGIDQVRVPYTLATSQIRALLVNVWGAGPDNMGASMVVIAYAVICILAYCSCYNDVRRGKLSVWLCFSSMAVLVTFGTMKCYWEILLSPFMVMLLFMEKRSIRIDFVLEAFSPILITGIYVITQSQVYGGRKTFDYLLFSYSKYLMNRRESHSNSDMIHYIKDTIQYPGEYENVFPALVVVFMITFMIINFPYYQHEDQERTTDEQKVWCQWGCVRIGILILWFVLNFWCLFK
ncbi:MAG: hypothetical protein K2I96_24220 [Lachnospiraceae bacterium]|nr:hypothetical protein [Lachnospiraceae bacterium]